VLWIRNALLADPDLPLTQINEKDGKIKALQQELKGFISGSL
jgi:hypothetical protein